jgi:hypothetical protein
MTELAHRRNHDFDIALYWDTSRDELFVVVEDISAGDRFSIAAPRTQALDVFHHPFRLPRRRRGDSMSRIRRIWRYIVDRPLV